jgi:hypothetical protein
VVRTSTKERDMGDSERRVGRRTFLGQSGLIAGGAALASTARSYASILGANDRISLAHIGIGNRGRELEQVASALKQSHNVEMTAVCDLWKVNRERAVDASAKYYGRPARAFQYLEDVLALKDVDAVLISTPEHSHSPILKMAVEAGKDAYVEKPMGNVLEEMKAARDAVRETRRVVQVGTQHRSEPYPQAACAVVQGGVLGDVSKVEVEWNYHGPRWRGREEAESSPGTTAARTRTRSRRCSSTRKGSSSATRRASATTRPASRATWARRRPS